METNRTHKAAHAASCRLSWAQLSRALLLAATAFAAVRAAAEPLRVCLIAGAGPASAETRRVVAGLGWFLEGAGPARCSAQVVMGGAGSSDVSGALEVSDVAVIWVNGGPLGEPGRSAFGRFLEKGGGLVVVGCAGRTWADWPEFEQQVLGARFGDAFEGGAPMRVINLYPHAVFTGVERLETPQAMLACDLAPDAQVIMEGTVGEETVPMGWLRRQGRARIVCLQPGGASLLGDAQYRGLVSNCVQWAGGRPVPRAPTLVQRASMADAFPGALAISFPGGPSLCFDTVRGGINYIWDGDFVDLRPWWTGHHGAPLRSFAARISGAVLYRERSMSPALHVGPGTGPSEFHFRGYRLGQDGFPELSYLVGGRAITEVVRPAAGGVGVECTFHADSGPGPLWLTLGSDSNAEIAVSGAAMDGNRIRFDAVGAGTFAVTFRGRAGVAP